MVSSAFRMVFMHPDQTGVSAVWDDTQRLPAKQFPKVAELMATAKTDVLAFTALPPEHWRKIWSNNPLERLTKEIKRRSNVVQIFPDERSGTEGLGSAGVQSRVGDELDDCSLSAIR